LVGKLEYGEGRFPESIIDRQSSRGSFRRDGNEIRRTNRTIGPREGLWDGRRSQGTACGFDPWQRLQLGVKKYWNLSTQQYT
jgi:hypothetical protein